MDNPIYEPLIDFLVVIENEVRKKHYDEDGLNDEQIAEQLVALFDLKALNEYFNGSCNTPNILRGTATFCTRFFRIIVAEMEKKEAKNG